MGLIGAGHHVRMRLVPAPRPPTPRSLFFGIISARINVFTSFVSIILGLKFELEKYIVNFLLGYFCQLLLVHEK